MNKNNENLNNNLNNNLNLNNSDNLNYEKNKNSTKNNMIPMLNIGSIIVGSTYTSIFWLILVIIVGILIII